MVIRPQYFPIERIIKGLQPVNRKCYFTALYWLIHIILFSLLYTSCSKELLSCYLFDFTFQFSDSLFAFQTPKMC